MELKDKKRQEAEEDIQRKLDADRHAASQMEDRYKEMEEERMYLNQAAERQTDPRAIAKTNTRIQELDKALKKIRTEGENMHKALVAGEQKADLARSDLAINNIKYASEFVTGKVNDLAEKMKKLADSAKALTDPDEIAANVATIARLEQKKKTAQMQADKVKRELVKVEKAKEAKVEEIVF